MLRIVAARPTRVLGVDRAARGQLGTAIRTLIADDHAMFRRGIASCLGSDDDFLVVGEAEDGDTAIRLGVSERPALAIIDAHLADGDGLRVINALREASPETRAVVCAATPDTLELYRAIEAGAVGYLLKAEMRVETLAASLRAVALGDGLIPPSMLGELVEHIGRMSREVWSPRGMGLTGLSPREVEILRLAAEGDDTREIALKLSYSERTVKNAIHDVVIKLGLRNRTHAVAYALRKNLI
jgi:DNA-binding NarL/FixJ family response regulator